MRGSADGARRGPNRNNDNTQHYTLCATNLGELVRLAEHGPIRLGAPTRDLAPQAELSERATASARDNHRGGAALRLRAVARRFLDHLGRVARAAAVARLNWNPNARNFIGFREPALVLSWDSRDRSWDVPADFFFAGIAAQLR